MTKMPSHDTSPATMEHHSSVPKTLASTQAPPAPTSDPVPHATEGARVFRHAPAPLFRAPDSHTPSRSSGVQSPYPRKAAV